jgi:predicted RNA-binding protein with PUA-like domain
MPTFLLKTEPSEFAFADLVATKRAAWDGVTNAAALIALRSMRKGDEALIYHTGLEKAIVGLARIATNPYEDPARPGTNDRGEPRFAVVDLAPVAAAPTPVPLARIKDDARFAKFPLVAQGRLSVMPVPAALDKVLRAWAGLA